LDIFRLVDVAGRKPHQLSGGQKQRCSIARALASEPRLLLLDEPARGLDTALRMELYETLRQVQKEFRIPALLVTHSLEECFELADEILILRNGILVQRGKPRELCERPGSIELAELLGIFNILPAQIRALDPSRNESVLRFREVDLRGPYFPGRLIGDRVDMLVTPQQLRAFPRNGRPGANQAAATLFRCVETPQYVRLEFQEGIMVEMPRREFLYEADNREWWIEFPGKSLRIL
ncbi:MAG: ATP-binding cassette domain-containing protein, partial [Bryobacteraceae bacterium]